jgi:uncharacterized protein
MYSAALLVVVYPVILAMFLGGIWIARRGILHDPASHRRWLVAAAALGLGVGLPLNAAYTWASDAALGGSGSAWMIAIVLAFVAGPILCLGYVAGLAFFWGTSSGRAVLAPLTHVGRMALTNYLLQTLICTTIFYSYGLGWFGRVGPAAAVGVALLVYAVQVPLSYAWLSRFRFGPAEWLWRSLTYGRRLPMRRNAAAPVVE